MEYIVKLLKEKNSYLKKFCTLNKAELFRLGEGDFSRLEFFYKSREVLLEMVAFVEKRIDEEMRKFVDPSRVSSDLKTSIQEELRLKDVIVSEILNLDLKIISLIETAKSTLIRELQDTTKNRQMFQAYNNTPTKRLKAAK